MDQVARNTNDIQALASQMTRMATLMEAAEKRSAESEIRNEKRIIDIEKRHSEDLAAIRDGIKSLQSSVTQTIALSDTVIHAKEQIQENKAEIRVLRHDMGTALQIQAAMPLMQEKITMLTVEMIEIKKSNEILKTAKATQDGRDGAIIVTAKTFWGVLGSAILLVGGFILKEFFTKQ